MGQEPLALPAAGVVLPAVEEDVLARGEGAGPEGAAQSVGALVSVDAHAGKVRPEGLLHGLPHPLRQGLASPPCLSDGVLHLGRRLATLQPHRGAGLIWRRSSPASCRQGGRCPRARMASDAARSASCS